MCFAIRAAATMVMIPNPRDFKDVLESIQKYKTTIFPGVPTMYNAINNHPDVLAEKYNLSTIKACISGSAPLMRETKEKFEALTGGKLVEGFGMSEAPTATHCNPLFGKNPPGSIGLPLPDVDARIISLDDEVTVLPPGEIGELVVKGPKVMKGYHNMPTETANCPARWLAVTGDIARMDEDGYFYIVDRKKELIKPGGYQVWPREVEEVIVQQSEGDGSGRRRRAGCLPRRDGQSLGRAQAGRNRHRRGDQGMVQGAHGEIQGADPRRIPQTSCPRPRWARSCGASWSASIRRRCQPEN